MKYLIKWRMAMAKSLLSEEPFTMSEIADKIGYIDKYVSNVFVVRNIGEARCFRYSILLITFI